MPDDTPRPSRSDAAYLAAYLALACGIAFFGSLATWVWWGPTSRAMPKWRVRCGSVATG